MAAASVLPPPTAIPAADRETQLRHSHLLLLLAIETALKAALSSVRMLEMALEEIRKIRSGLHAAG
jgi:hypothetical protein